MSELRAVPKPHKSRKKPRKPIRRSRVRQKRAKPRRQANRDPGLLAWVAQQPCWVTGMRNGETSWTGDGETGNGFLEPDFIAHIDVAHVRTKRLGGDRYNVIPLEHWSQHTRQHEIGIESWLKENGLTRAQLDKAAVEYTERYDRERSVG